MVWQDTLIVTASILMGFSLMPQVAQGFKKKKGEINLKTSFFYIIGLIMILISFFTLKLYLSTFVTLLSTIMWITLFMQRLYYK